MEIHLIDRFKLEKSIYDEVEVIQYTPAEKHPENKCVGIVDFKIRKLIYAATQKDFDKKINEELDRSVADDKNT